MTVTVKPLVWETIDYGVFAKSAFGVIDVWACGGEDNCCAAKPLYCFEVGGKRRVGGFLTADAAKLAAERWYKAKVLDCLEPADAATAAEFVTTYAQCRGEYDR